VGFVGASVSSCLDPSMFAYRTLQVKVSLAAKGEFCDDGPLLPDPPSMLRMAAGAGRTFAPSGGTSALSHRVVAW
jgi:hypothetical protein